MPREVGKLSFLKKLSVFVVGEENGFGIEELKGLNLLRGKLEIHNLENVRDGIDANKANLKEKQNIHRLELYWSSSYARNVINDDHAVLEGLQPHRNLKSLAVHNYVALNFPRWMMSASYCLPNLVLVVLRDCYKCVHLPAFGNLPFLKVLHVWGMNTVKCIGGEFYGSNEETTTRVVAPSISFPSLKELSLKQMPNLEEWVPSSSSFPCLEQLEIDQCTKLTITPSLFPCLQKIKYWSSNGIPLRSVVTSNLTSLASIVIRGSEELRFLPEELLRGSNVLRSLKVRDCPKLEAFLPNNEELQLQVLLNSSLESIEIYGCPVLMSVPGLWSLKSLRFLCIVECPRLKSLPDGVQCLTALEELRMDSLPFPAIKERFDKCLLSLRVLQIWGWSKLNFLPDQLQYLTSLKELKLHGFPSLLSLPEWFGNLSSLRCLEIHWCQNLMYFPSQEQMQRLTALETLELHRCRLLEDRCSDEESHKIAHIPNFCCY